MMSYLKKYKIRTLSIILLSVMMNLSAVATISLNAALLNRLVDNQWGEFLKIAGISMVLDVLYILTRYGHQLQKEKLAQVIAMDIRSDIAHRIAQSSYEEVMKQNIATYVSWETQDIDQITDRGLANALYFMDSLFMLLFATVSLWRFHWLLGMTTILLACLLILVPKWFHRVTDDATEQLSKGNEQFMSTTQNLWNGFDVFYSFNAIGQLQQRIQQASEALADIKVHYKKEFGRVNLLTSIINFLCKIAIDALAMILVFLGQVSIGVISAAGSLTYNCFASLEQIVQQLSQLNAMQVYFDKFNQLKKQDIPEIKLEQQLELKQVTVTIGEKKVMAPLLWKIERGKKYALLGDSGSGKSTLLRFLAGRNTHFTGEVILDGIPLTSDTIEALRNITIYVDQKNHLFNGTIANNITLWCHQEEIPLVSELELETFTQLQDEVGQFGTKLSGGQRQRIALQRALLESGKILLFDESTANLDDNSAKAIEKVILQNPDLTVVIVTHHFFEEHRSLFDEIISLTTREGKS